MLENNVNPQRKWNSTNIGNIKFLNIFELLH